jgi:hypothetical protein
VCLLKRHAKGIRSLLLTTALLSCVLFASAMSPTTSSFVRVGKPVVVLHASKTSITFPCPPGSRTIASSCPADLDFQVRLTSTARDFRRQPLFAYTVGVGRIIGEGATVTWDLNGVPPGVYTATVEARDNKNQRAVSSVTVTLSLCEHCLTCDGLCPQLSLLCYDEVKAGTPITCKVVIQPLSDAVKYVWSVYGYSGEDLSGRLRIRDTYVSIPTATLAGQTISVEVKVQGLDPSCNATASSQTKVKP